MSLALHILTAFSIGLLIGLPAGWVSGCLIGWARCRRRTKRDRPPYWGPPEPLNWRLFLGPKRYFDWYEARFL